MSASALPPSECFSRQVSLESRYGTCTAAAAAAVGGRQLAVEPLAVEPFAAAAVAAASVSAVMTCAIEHAVGPYGEGTGVIAGMFHAVATQVAVLLMSPHELCPLAVGDGHVHNNSSKTELHPTTKTAPLLILTEQYTVEPAVVAPAAPDATAAQDRRHPLSPASE